MSGDLSVRVDNRRTIWVTEISRATFEDQGIEELESDGGLFVVLEDRSTRRFDVLAKVASLWAGKQFLDIFASALGTNVELDVVGAE